MSRVGKKPISIGSGTVVSINDGVVKIEGPKGKTDITLIDGVEASVKDGTVVCSIGESCHPSRFGLQRSLIANAVEGCSTGFKKVLEVVGVGYRASVSGQFLDLSLGHSHPIKYSIPQGITITVDKQNKISIEGVSKQLVGQVAADIRSFREPEPYKGKGVKYSDERIIRKAGKAGAK